MATTKKPVAKKVTKKTAKKVVVEDEVLGS